MKAREALPLLSDGARQRLRGMSARHQRQVVAHDIKGDGCKHQNHADDETPVLMRPFPIRAVGTGDAAASRSPFVSRVTVVMIFRFHIRLLHSEITISLKLRSVAGGARS